LVAGVLAGVAVLAVICPLVDAAVRRRSELAADRFAADHGLAVPLMTALRALDGGCSISCGWTRRIVAPHPAFDRRIEALTAPR
ncbi:MAG: M48 family metalloprotease, partial [Actinomycetes bacterium]